MRRLIPLLLLAATCAAECEQTTRKIHGNYAYDLAGQPETRPYHWGSVEAQVVPLTFNPPPAGQRIRILRVSGDVTARWSSNGHGPAVAEPGHYTGVLAAVLTHPSSRGSEYADLAADDHFAYVQVDIGSTGVARAHFDEEYAPNVINAVLHTPESLAIEALRGDLGGAQPHTLYFKTAKYLDETGLSTHVEITWQVSFCYEGAL